MGGPARGQGNPTHSPRRSWYATGMTDSQASTAEFAARAAGAFRAGNLREALTEIAAGLAMAPNDLPLLRLLADVAEAANDIGRALKACRQLAALSPRDPLVHVKAGRLRMRLFDNAGAAADFNAALAIDQNNTHAMDGLADALRIDGAADEARAILLRRAEVTGDKELRAATKFKAALTQPAVARDAAEFAAARERFAAALAAGPESAFSNPWRLGLGPNFYLGYQAQDDRSLQEALARYYTAASPALVQTAAHVGARGTGRPIRVGIVSNFYSAHTVGYLTFGLAAHLDRRRFELTLFRTPGAAQDGETPRFLKAAPLVDLPADLTAARAKIAEARLDVLHYPEIGMDHFAYFLAFARLATVQSVAWGHPITTGLPNIDLFLSVDAMEPPGAEAHYCEKLVRLRGLSFAGETSPVADPGVELDSTRPAYLCAQSLFKIHPDFDDALAQLLRRDRDGVVYFFSYSPHADAILKARLRQHLGGDIERVRILPRTTPRKFLGIVRAADVALDVPQWSGGKTSLEALSAGTPIVHWPGEFMRGRHTLAFYRRMGVDAPVVQSSAAYVDVATRLVHDKGFRANVRGQIAANSARLFNDAASIREIEDVWEAALAART